MDEREIKDFYRGFADKIQEKRLYSPYILRRYFHQQNYLSVLKSLKPADKILEVGCGEGIVSVFAAKRGISITAVDISRANLLAAKELANKEGVENKISFIEGDAENLPFDDNSFDVVIADNVLEHLPSFEKGLREVKRVTKKRAIIALPTAMFNLSVFALLGGDVYWKITRKTPYAVFVGFFRYLLGIVLGEDGVNEGYIGKKELPHVWRYPWAIKRELKKAGFKIISFEPISMIFPYFSFLLPMIKFLDKYKTKPILRNFGSGSVTVVEKI